MKKYPFFFLLLFLTLFLGTMGLVGISIVSSQVKQKLKDNANELLTSDIAVAARRELFPEEIQKTKKNLRDHSVDHYQIIDIYSMVTHSRSKGSRLVEIRATEEGFPFYGRLLTSAGEFESCNLYISQDLVDLWGIESGDELKVGEVTMKVSGVVTEDSSLGIRGFSLAPRIYFPLARLAETGLIRPGATGSFAHHFKLNDPSKESVQKIKTLIYKDILDTAVKVRIPEDSSAQTGRVINTLTNFMALSALVGLILALVGIFYLYQSHLLARLKDLCLLNLHGLTKGKIVLGIMSQFTLIFILVILVELSLVIPLYEIFAPNLSEAFGMELSDEVNLLGAVGEIPYLFGLALFILIPLLFGLMRTSMGVQLKASKLSMGRFRFYDFLPFLGLLWVFSIYLGQSNRTGNLFFISLLLIFGLSALVVKLGQWILKKFIGKKRLLLPTIENGIALRSLTRSGHKLTLSFLSLAMGATLISLILQLDKMILREFALDNKKPALFIFDIQEEQMESLVKHAEALNSPVAYVTPMIRARLEQVNGKKFVRDKKAYDFRTREEDEEARFRNNGMNLTFRSYLTEAERILEGEPFPREGFTEGRLPYISIEKRWSQRMNIDLGDKLTFDVQGVPFEGVVHNIKEVKWTSFYPNFFVTIEPGLIDQAPKTYLAILPSGPKEEKVRFQKTTVEKFPNISFIDVEELVGKLTGLFEKSRRAIEVISWLSLTIGLVILYGLSHDQVYRRYYDLALMKSLGLSSAQLRLNLLFEFGALFVSAMGLGLFLGWGMAQVIGKEIFKVSPTIDWERILYPALLLTFLCLATILMASWRAISAKPKELLSES